MISTEVALIMTAGGIGGALLISQTSLRNWFKKENWKSKQKFDTKEMNIRFKAMERDLKLKESPPIPPREKGVVESIQGINPEIIQTIAGLLSKNEDEDYIEVEEKKPDIMETILDVAQKNPELAGKFIEGITKKVGVGEKPKDDFQSQN